MAAPLVPPMKKNGPAPRGSSPCLSLDLCRHRSAVQTPDTGKSASIQTLCMHALADMFTRNYRRRYEISELSVQFYLFRMWEYFIIDFIVFSYAKQHIKIILTSDRTWKLILPFAGLGHAGLLSLFLNLHHLRPGLCSCPPHLRGQVAPRSFTLQPQPASLQGSSSSFPAASSPSLADPASRVGPPLLGSPSAQMTLYYSSGDDICRFLFIVGFKST